MNPTARPRNAQPARSSAAPSDPVTDELRRYDDHLRDVCGLAAGKRRKHCRIVAQLLRKKPTWQWRNGRWPGFKSQKPSFAAIGHPTR